ncbi:uncharacterized protein EAF01_004236 [Botrytis porri]|uniref:uncharacterized protein n=1 Tax=Botrytis porri TaxID=87229 RepID=UPI001900B1BD|nr:uncharacterized protein EAF01_004236 [Botrytis porri]KAF7908481.1 hypothetical protein EAF01_004236 [Botrytis porri]
MQERETAKNFAKLLEKKPLATEFAQLSIDDLSPLSVLALATEAQVNVVDNDSFNIATASLNIIIGLVRYDKSTLLRTLSGESFFSSGIIHMRTCNMAFCHWDAWISNCVIRQAVIGTNDSDHEWHQKCLKRLCLTMTLVWLQIGRRRAMVTGLY